MNGQYRPGDVVLGKWKLTRLIGEGSFGKVFAAEREDFGVTYQAAVKIITIPQSQSEVQSARSEGMDDASVTAYFRSFVEEIIKEFELMSKLKGTANVVSYEDHEVVPHSDGVGWDIFIRMELLTPLLTRIQNGAMTRPDVLRLGIDLCKALELCRKHNIIHRDIKPENIFVSEMGDYKLGDFGIARTVEKTTGGLSKKGTYTYMAPEVYREQPYGPAADLYSLGLVLYRLLNDNRTPFLPPYPQPITHSDRESALARRMGGEALPTPCNAEGPLADIILKACAFDPKDRYASADALRQALEAVLYQRPQGAVTAEEPLPEPTQRNIPTEAPAEKTDSVFSAPPEEKTESVFTSTAKPEAPAPEPPAPATAPAKSKKKLPLILGGAAVLVVLILALALGGGDDAPTPPADNSEPTVSLDDDRDDSADSADAEDPERASTVVNPGFENADHLAVTFEDPADAFYKGKNQVARSELDSAGTVLYTLGNSNYTTSYTRGQFMDLVSGFKDRLDLLGVPYAFGYYGNDGEDLAVRISPEVLGVPSMVLLESYGGKGPMFDQYYVGNARKDLQLSGIESLSCTYNGTEWEITVTLDETDTGTLRAYLSGDPQSALYFAVTGGIVFGHMDIDEMTDESTLVFHGIDCLASVENQESLSYLMDLMVYAYEHPLASSVNSAFVLREDYTSLEASDGESNQIADSAYGLQYVTAVDQQVFAAIQTAFPNAAIQRPVDTNNLYASKIYVYMNDEAPQNMTDEEARQYSMDIVQQAYTLGKFDGGSYSFVYFYMGSGGYLGFEKDETGVMRLKDAPDSYMDQLIASDFYLPKLYPGVLKTYQEEGWVYDEAGRLIREVTYNKDGSVLATEEADYDEAGNQVGYRHYQSDGKLTQSESYVYDDQGQMTEAFSYNPDTGEVQMRAEYTYDADGTQHGTVYDADGNVSDQF